MLNTGLMCTVMLNNVHFFSALHRDINVLTRGNACGTSGKIITVNLGYKGLCL